jgi:hypothetical protein
VIDGKDDVGEVCADGDPRPDARADGGTARSRLALANTK